MAYIELVIKIDEQTYNNFVRNEYSRADAIAMHAALTNGAVLQNGHGDLIDRKELLKQPMDTANYPSNYVRVAQTIIEADESEAQK